MPSERDLLCLLCDLRGRLASDVSLSALATRAGWSRFHLHRAFRRVVGETPKQFTLRLRLERAAGRLVESDDSVLGIAAATGFASHEVFTRAFRRHYGCAPSAYRVTALEAMPKRARARHAAAIDRAGPCIGLFHMPLDLPVRRVTMPTLSIARQDVHAQPVLIVRMKAARHELPAAIGEGLGKAYPHAQKAGLAGPPFTRYLSSGPGLFSIEVGMPLARAGVGEGDVVAGELPGGPCAVAVHAGPYEQLGETYAAVERWMAANGVHPRDAPWESYITDPADHPDPADWRTEVYWPLAE